MGNALQRSCPGDSDIPTPKIVALTPAEVKIVKETWKIPSANMFDSAELIFYTFLARYPDHQQKFSAFKDVPLAELKGTAGFRAHASRIFNALSGVIDALDRDVELKGIKMIVADIGKFHLKKKVSKKSQNELRGILIEILSNVCKLDDEGKVAWNKLFDIFYHIMFETMDGRSDQFY